MKKLICIFTTILCLCCGCMDKTKDDLKYTEKKESKMEINDVESKGTSYLIKNPFFFQEGSSSMKYKGYFSIDEEIEEMNVNLYFKEKLKLKNGILYELKIEQIEGISEERLRLGYFYVLQYKIYKIEPTEENLELLKRGKIPKDGIIVCEDKELKESLKSEKKGEHQYWIVDGDKREYHLYNDGTETGYFETFIWKKNVGLIFYQSGYGAQRDLIKLDKN